MIIYKKTDRGQEAISCFPTARSEKSMKKLAGIICCLLMLLLCACATADTEISETNFPDANFREFVKAFDTDGNNVLDDAEIAAVTEMDCSEKEISSLKGIEFFTKLALLSCKGNHLETLDVSSNTELVILRCYGNSLTALNVRNNPLLENLEVFNNQLTSIDVSGNTELTYLHLQNNQLNALDVSSNTRLREFYCDDNELTSLTLGNLPSLDQFACGNNQLRTLDIRGCTALEKMTKSAGAAFCQVDAGRTYFGWMEQATPDVWPEKCFFIDQRIKIVTSTGTIDTSADISGTVVTLSESSATLVRTADVKNPTLKLTATVEPEGAARAGVEWTSSNPEVASVDQDGTVTALKAGKAEITCTAMNGSGAKAACSIAVQDRKVTKIKLNKTKASLSVTLSKKGTLTLKASVYPADAVNKAVSWKSSNTKVAKVSSKGKVTAVGAGVCTITCTAKDGSGIKKSCKITVIADEVASGNLKFSLDHKKKIATVIGPQKSNLKIVKVPDTIQANGKTYKVRAIRAKAFRGMESLVTFRTGRYMIWIGASAFENCTKLKNIVVQSKNITRIDANAFKKVSKNVKLYMPKTMTKSYATKLIKLLTASGIQKITLIIE